jgi:hypothetical protein
VGDGTCHNYPQNLWITPGHGTAPVRMGTRNFGSFFQGGLAEVRVWNRALSPSEVADLYAAVNVPRAGLVAEYLFNEGAGTIAHDSARNHDGTIFDASWPPAALRLLRK